MMNCVIWVRIQLWYMYHVFCQCHSPLVREIINGLTISKTQIRKPIWVNTLLFFMSSSRSRMLVRTRSTISGEAVEKGWLWSVQPLVISAKCLGINLSNGNRQSTCWWFITVLVLLFFIITQFLCLKFVINNYKETSQTFIFEINNNSDTFAWNTVMDFVNFAVHSLGIHIMFVFAFRSRWCLLVEAFQNLESFSDFNFFNKIRKASILGAFWIIILVRIIFKNMCICNNLQIFHL